MSDISHARDVTGFTSLPALREAHQLRLRETSISRRSAAGAKPLVADLSAFVEAIEATGRILEDDIQRIEAQSILDYWSAELVNSIEIDAKTWTPPILAPFAPDAPKDSSEADVSSKAEISLRESEARQQIRFSALARQWRNSERKPGYLLKGGALDEAKRFRTTDSDIEEFVAESERAEHAADRSRRNSLYGLIGILLAAAVLFAGMAVFAFNQRDMAIAEREQVKKERQIAEEQRKAAEEQSQRANNLLKELYATNALLDEEKRNTEDKLAKANEALAQSNQRQSELIAKLSAALKDAVKLVLANRLKRSDVSSDLLPALDAEILAEIQAGAFSANQLPPEFQDALGGTTTTVDKLPTDDPLLAGYDIHFLGLRIDQPQVDPVRWPAPKLLNYVNYSLMMEPGLRQALFSASNVDRQKLRVLRRTADHFAMDPRLLSEDQLDDAFFKDPLIDRGHLVTRHEIAWGRYFPDDDVEAAQRLATMVNVFTNTSPQFDTFNRSIWSGAEQWVLNEHNKAASKVTVFSGPVFGSDDIISGGVRIPHAFWKIAISARVDSKAAFVADAFIVPQYSGNPAAILPEAPFAPDVYRVPVSKVEELTGLDFGLDVRTAVDSTALTSPSDTGGDLLASQVTTIDAPTPEQRKAYVSRLVDALRNLPDVEKRKIVFALAGLAADGSIGALTETGRYNLLYVLSVIPKTSWDAPAWLDLKAAMRRAAADLRQRAQAEEVKVGPDANKFLDTLVQNIGLDANPPNIVFPQFAGMKREDVVAVMDKLRLLGWNIQKEERTLSAANVNEVRYGDPGDQAAAELIAADLRAAGLTNVRSAKRIRGGKKGNIEIWVSR